MKLFTLVFIFYFLYVSLINGTAKEGSIAARINVIDPYSMISDGQTLLKEGDLVVRLNRDASSQFIRNLNRHDKNYSHSGIVIYENGYPFIYHMVMGDENPDGKLKKDSLIRFCNPRKNMSYAIFRYDVTTDEIKRLKATLHDWYTKGIRFDAAFNLSTDDKMYCSEMVSKALEKATANRILINTIELTPAEAGLFSIYSHQPLSYSLKLKVVPIDELYTNSNCRLVKKFNFQGGK